MPDLSVADNVCITDPPRRFGLIDRRAQRRRAEALLAEVGCEDVNPLLRVRDLPLSRRQMVEIAKALGRNPRLLILDEATSALTSADVEKVYALLADLRRRASPILFISHRMHEVEALGRHAARCSATAATSRPSTRARAATGEIVQLMIGRDVAAQFPPKPVRPAPGAVPRRSRTSPGSTGSKASSLSVGAGEIVGLGGLDGQGQKELLLALFGVLRGVTGRVTVDGRGVRPRSPAAAKTARHRHRARARGPQDRRPDAADVDRRQPRSSPPAGLSRAALSSTAAEERARSMPRSRSSRSRSARPSDPVVDPLGRQPAEGRHRQMADDRAAHHPAQRSDPRHRRRHQAGTLSPDARTRRPWRGRSCSTPPTMTS